MKERPILFSGPMVRAIIEGRKTQTRRVVKPIKWLGEPEAWCPRATEDTMRHIIGDFRRYCPYGQPGDRLWVRETFCIGHDSYDGNLVTTDKDGDDIDPKAFYRATTDQLFQWLLDDGEYTDKIPWKPSIHMPRWASRITLEITDVRVQRVQEISGHDARAEGVQLSGQLLNDGKYGRRAFACLWDSINSERGFGWGKNPWVWALTFRRVEETK